MKYLETIKIKVTPHEISVIADVVNMTQNPVLKTALNNLLIIMIKRYKEELGVYTEEGEEEDI